MKKILKEENDEEPEANGGGDYGVDNAPGETEEHHGKERQARLHDIARHEIDVERPENREYDQNDEPSIEHFDYCAGKHDIGYFHDRKRGKRPIHHDFPAQ